MTFKSKYDHPGCPTKYEERFCDELVAKRAAGQSIYEIAYGWGVDVRTMFEWRKVHKNFSHSYKIGHTAFKTWAVTFIKSHLTSKNLNQTALIYLMKLLQMREFDDDVELPCDFCWPLTIEDKQKYIDSLFAQRKISTEYADRLVNIIGKQAKLQEHIDFEARLVALEQRGGSNDEVEIGNGTKVQDSNS